MKIKHILKAKDFREIVTTGGKTKGSLLCLYSLGDSSDTEPAVGVIVSKKSAPRAVTRNHIRRIIYAFYAEIKGKIPAGTSIVVRVISPVEKKRKKETAKQLRTELNELTRQAKLSDD